MPRSASRNATETLTRTFDSIAQVKRLQLGARTPDETRLVLGASAEFLPGNPYEAYHEIAKGDGCPGLTADYNRSNFLSAVQFSGGKFDFNTGALTVDGWHPGQAADVIATVTQSTTDTHNGSSFTARYDLIALP